VSSESSCAVRLARHSQNAWARHVECVESSRAKWNLSYCFVLTWRSCFADIRHILVKFCATLQVTFYVCASYVWLHYLIDFAALLKPAIKIIHQTQQTLRYDDKMYDIISFVEQPDCVSAVCQLLLCAFSLQLSQPTDLFSHTKSMSPHPYFKLTIH